MYVVIINFTSIITEIKVCSSCILLSLMARKFQQGVLKPGPCTKYCLSINLLLRLSTDAKVSQGWFHVSLLRTIHGVSKYIVGHEKPQNYTNLRTYQLLWCILNMMKKKNLFSFQSLSNITFLSKCNNHLRRTKKTEIGKSNKHR